MILIVKLQVFLKFLLRFSNTNHEWKYKVFIMNNKQIEMNLDIPNLFL